jgi:hypothetical protein
LFGHGLLYLISPAKYKLSAPEDEKGSPFHLPVLRVCILLYKLNTANHDQTRPKLLDDVSRSSPFKTPGLFTA